MKLDGAAVWYFLEREFSDVVGMGLPRRALFDYPILYDVSAEMGGHTVLVPSHERPVSGPAMEGVLCVCVGEESARCASESGLPVVLVRGEVTFQHLYNFMQAVFVRNEGLDARLRALVDAYAGFRPLVEACTDAWGFPCGIIDAQYAIVCQAPAEGPGAIDLAAPQSSMMEPDSVDLFMASTGYRRLRGSRGVFVVPGSNGLMMRNVFSGERLVGAVVTEHGEDALSARFARFLLGYLGGYVEEMYSRMGSFGLSAKGHDLVKAALSDVVAGAPSGAAVLGQALVESGHGDDSPYLVARIVRSFTHEGSADLDYLARRFELSWPHAYCFTAGGGLFMLVDVGEGPLAAGAGFSRELSVTARDSLAKVGVSDPFSNMDDLPGAMVQASAALEQGGGADPTHWSYWFADYALPWLAGRLVGDEPVACLCHPAVRMLDRHDDENGTELLRTLRVFMDSRYNATAAAAELFVARSTLLNRLERIRELTGVTLDDPAERLHLGLSFLLRDNA